VTANSSIRFLVLCGKESAVFHPGQALVSLLQNGVTGSRRIIAAIGHLPVLGNVPLARIESFRRQVELIDRTGEYDLARLAAEVRNLAARAVAPFEAGISDSSPIRAEPGSDPSPEFVAIRPGGNGAPWPTTPRAFS
jgi:tetrahydromethanopterin S-methyltransferase subunit A